jgi:chromosome partitioning protein
MGIDPRKIDKGIYEAIIGQKSVFEIIKSTSLSRYKVAPSSASLAGAGIELVNMEEREYRLGKILKEVKEEYDYIIIDGPPSLGLLTINSLVAAEDILIPIQSEYYALEGLGQLLETIDLVQENLKPELNVLGVVITMFDKRNKLSGEVKKELKQYFGDKVFASVIPRNVRLAEAPSYGKSILHYDHRSKGARAYEKLAKEIMKL